MLLRTNESTQDRTLVLAHRAPPADHAMNAMPEHFAGFLHLAAAVTCFKKLPT